MLPQVESASDAGHRVSPTTQEVTVSDIKQSVQEQFGPVAANYRTSPVHAAGEDLGAIAAVVQQYASPVVLDVGCGAGHVARTVAPLSARVVALDLTEAML